jgi:hypothetical protein
MSGKTKTSEKKQEQDKQQYQVIWQDKDNILYYCMLLIAQLSWHHSAIQIQ